MRAALARLIVEMRRPDNVSRDYHGVPWADRLETITCGDDEGGDAADGRRCEPDSSETEQRADRSAPAVPGVTHPVEQHVKTTGVEAVDPRTGARMLIIDVRHGGRHWGFTIVLDTESQQEAAGDRPADEKVRALLNDWRVQLVAYEDGGNRLSADEAGQLSACADELDAAIETTELNSRQGAPTSPSLKDA